MKPSSGDLLKYLKVMLMKSPNNEGNGFPADYLLIPNETSRMELDYIQLSCLPEGSYGNPQTTLPIAKTIGCSSRNDGKIPLLKTIPAQLTEHGGTESVPM